MALVASDPDGVVAAVEFYDCDALLGVDTEAPYTWTSSGTCQSGIPLEALSVQPAG